MIPPELVEAVAREFCKQMGKDPDELVWPKAFEVARWQLYEDDARKAIAFARAVKLCDTEGKG